MDVEWQWWKACEDTQVPPTKAVFPEVSSSLTNQAISSSRKPPKLPFDRLEEVMDIVRLHRLEEDLDLRSLSRMRLSNKALGRIAARMLQTRVKSLEFVLAPFTDGFAVFGHSRFFRRLAEDAQETMIHFEHGRPVEYVRCGLLSLKRKSDFTYSVPDNAFKWSCEELLLGNLDQMTGDIANREYCGQKLCLYWKSQGPDALHQKLIKMGEIWIEASPTPGTRVYQLHHSQLEFRIQHSKTKHNHDIMVEYIGEMNVAAFQLDLRTLVDLPCRAC